MATGIATIDFGGHPGSNEALVVITGQTLIQTTSNVEAWIMADDITVDHTANDHRYFAALVALTCGTPTASTGFTIYARSFEKLTGTFKIRWVWAD